LTFHYNPCCFDQLFLAMGYTRVLMFFLLQSTTVFSAGKKIIDLLVHHTLKFEKISSLRDTLSNSLSLPLCYRAANNVRETLGVSSSGASAREARQRGTMGKKNW